MGREITELDSGSEVEEVTSWYIECDEGSSVTNVTDSPNS